MDTALPSISPEQLARRLGRADAPLLLDVRRRPRFDASPDILSGAVYCDPDDVAAFALREVPRDVVVYCVYGHNVSEDAVRTLLAAGWNASRLAGGIEGGEPGVDADADVAAWRSVQLPRVPKPAERSA